MIDRPGSTEQERHDQAMGWDTDPHACPTCGRPTDPADAALALRLATLNGDVALADAAKKRLVAARIDPAPIEAKALEEKTRDEA